MRKIIIIFFLCCIYGVPSVAQIATVDYVDASASTKVETVAGAQQTMAGEYVITGTLKVPTQPLPSAQ